MKLCKMCKAKNVKRESEIFLPMYNLYLCKEHYIEFFENRVRKAIDKWKMFRNEDKLILGVSGGKDSMSLWYILSKLGYNVTAYHLDLEIEGFSDISREVIVSFAEKNNLKVVIEKMSEYFNGMKVYDIARELGRPVCAVCGTLKRYVLTMKSKEFDVLLTGHNLDDEVAVLMGNVLFWKMDYLARQHPVSPAKYGFPKKVKPLILVTDWEVKMYTKFIELPVVEQECPFSKGATTIFYKNILDQLSQKIPSVKLNFFQEFLKYHDVFSKFDKKEELNTCKICGYPTTGEICSVCRIKQKLGILPKT